MRKPRVSKNPERKPGRPLSSVRETESFYVLTELLEINRRHAFETGTTKSSIVEKLLADYYGYGISNSETVI